MHIIAKGAGNMWTGGQDSAVLNDTNVAHPAPRKHAGTSNLILLQTPYLRGGASLG